ncbi:hypothetical protein CISG_03870 [Coccidioides immitis RMSCC 3703]|uniref:Myb-like domain-containing protein n=1 Tax=Coccidioides immitis RMSCC 3703 TaxID=454286 RepID=A0A0J8TJK5_COCIT|nr:hypothetical protein CISG_03870 [Coccidioides immitis RMSCC 3703]
MPVVWTKDALERLIAALLASHPGFTPDYRAMAVYFGQGATYDSLQHRFREYRRMAESMTERTPRRNNNCRAGGVPSTPRTARAPNTATLEPIVAVEWQSPMIGKGASIEHSILLDDDDDDDGSHFIKNERGATPIKAAPKAEPHETSSCFNIVGLKQEDDVFTETAAADSSSTAEKRARQPRAETVTDDWEHSRYERIVEVLDEEV